VSVTVNSDIGVEKIAIDRSAGNNYGRTQTPQERPARPITPEPEQEWELE
jgi:hypothetical protein